MRRAARFALLVLGLTGCDPVEASMLRRMPVERTLRRASSSVKPPMRCPREMVDVAGRFCIDRYEASLSDRRGRRLSPYHHSSPTLALRDHRRWEERARRVGPWSARQIPLPELPAWQREGEPEIVARSERGRIPSAYLDLESARRACAAADKRLCTRDEWVTACRGEKRTRHPYGEKFEAGRCNLGRLHPAAGLHGKGELGELDPRLNLVKDEDQRPLLLATGAASGCTSTWAGETIHDMVGNLDEWIDDPTGVFVGAFYARDVVHGCDARVEIHSPDYYDYTLGTRCCR
jgi:formylglycine-generating enzyme required for sulfatase activity